jgi:hypothetical protein
VKLKCGVPALIENGDRADSLKSKRLPSPPRPTARARPKAALRGVFAPLGGA